MTLSEFIQSPVFRLGEFRVFPIDESPAIYVAVMRCTSKSKRNGIPFAWGLCVWRHAQGMVQENRGGTKEGRKIRGEAE